MKKIFIQLALIFSALISYSQTVNIEYLDNIVKLNNTEIDKTKSFSEIKSILGEPIIYKEYPTGKTNYHYEDLGISVHTVNDNITFIGVNFNWDGDKTFPQTTFEGNFKINDSAIDQKSNDSILDQIKNIEFKKVMTGFYIAKNEKDGKQTFILIGFKDGKITQVGFEFH